MNSSLSTLISLKSKYPGFYWGENESGYYWGDKSKFGNEKDWVELTGGFTSLEELLEDVDKYNLQENSDVKDSYNDEFYLKLLSYLSEEQYLFLHWGSDTYQQYYWWVKDTEVGRKGIRTLKELVEDIFSKIKYLAADY